MKQLWQVLLCSMLMGVLSCKKPPDYPKTPEISNVKVTKFTVKKVQPGDLTFFEDSVTISCDFKDGDGDLGRSDGVTNYYAAVLRKKDNTFVSILDTIRDTTAARNILRIVPLDKNGTFFSLNPDGRQGPIEGKLYFGVSTKFPILNLTEYTLKFFVQIKDNAGNLSNTLETPEVTVKYYSQ